MSKPRLKPYLTEPFTNSINQVIAPGDAIVVVTTSAGSISINTGRYLGLRKTVGWRDREYINTVIETDHIKIQWLHNQTYEEWSWKTVVPDLEKPVHPEYPRFNRIDNWGYRTVPDPEYQTKLKAYHEAFDEYNKASERNSAKCNAYKQNNFHEVKTPYTTRHTLQLNRIFKIETPLASIGQI